MSRSLCWLLAGACSLGLFAAAAWPQEEAPPADTSGQPTVLTLEDCVAIALEHNPTILTSLQDIESSRAGVDRQQASYYPLLDLTAAVGPGTGISNSLLSGTVGGGSGPDIRLEGDATLDMTFYRTGRRQGVEQAKATLASTELSHQDTIQRLVESVIVDYFAVLAYQELERVAEVGLEAAQSHLHDVRIRIREGAAAEVDVYEADEDVAQAELDLINSRGNTRIGLAQLRYTLGIPPGAAFELAPSDWGDQEELPTLQGALDLAAELRPDLGAARHSVRARAYALEIADKQDGPSFDVGGSYRYSVANWRNTSPYWAFEAAVSWPIFDGHEGKAAVSQARASWMQSRAQLQQITNQVVLEVETALIDVDRARERMTATDASYSAAEARLNAARAKYREGVGILLEVTDARSSYTQAAAAQVQARFDHRVARAALRRVLGQIPLPMLEQETTVAEEAGADD